MTRGSSIFERAARGGLAAVAAILTVAALATLATAQGLFLPTRPGHGSRPQAGDPDYLEIGPGKVRLSFTRGGRLMDLVPAWTAGRSVIGGGGFVVFAAGPDGELVELVNTSLGDLAVGESTRGTGVCHEGMAGGFRAPSLDPDDDHDGRADEDRLDGVDNDGDGKIDEDFAAIGDEMVVTGFAGEVPFPGGELVFHQECYAWSLPHIDGAVMVSLYVRNEGVEPLHDVRLGTVLQVRGPVSFSQPVMEARLPGGVAAWIPCWKSSAAGGGSILLVALPARGRGNGWLGGYVPVAGDFAAALRETAVRGGQAAAGRFGSAEVEIDGDANVYALSPPVAVLQPGAEASIEFALVVTPPGSASVNDTAIDAFKTYRGDGDNLYLPPPLSMTPRVLWGHYRPARGKEAVLAVELDNLGPGSVSTEEISFFSGMTKSQIEQARTQTGEPIMLLHGDTVEGILQRRGRITLEGRLRSGEFFEAILRPKGLSSDPRSLSDMEAQRFWKSSGKLRRELLTGSPNPFRDATTIFYEVPSVVETDDGTRIQSTGAFETSVKVYNVRGRLVAVLVDRQEFAGVHSVNWNAVDESGNAVASGVYYIKLQIEQRFVTRRLTLLK
ncbi:MAG: FlgD immunoglobulin-like domain containing protein [Candidatus Krumholzibacteriia bacterium]